MFDLRRPLFVAALLLQNQRLHAFRADRKVDHYSHAIRSARNVIKVDLFESILRDGEQGARRTLRPESKGVIARSLEEDVGAKIIDIGLPGASPLDFEGAKSAVSQTQHATLSALAHGTPSEIKFASKVFQGAEHRSRISTFHRPLEISSRYEGSSNAVDVEKRLLRQTKRAVKVASGLAKEVQYYLVYAGNRRPDFLAELAHAASNAGATHVVIADSQSALTPSRAHSLTLRVKEAVNDGTKIAIHCHNQMNLALPNTLASIKAGATQVESCLLGIGDAGGNLATELFFAYCEHFKNIPLEEEDDMFPLCTAAGTSLPAAVSLAEEVADLLKFNVGENQPIVGERSYTCTTGIHQDQLGHLGARTTLPPSKLGREWKISLNRHSSKKAVVSVLKKYPRLKSNHGEGVDEHLADAVYAYLSYQVSIMDEEAIVATCDKLLEAYEALRGGGVLLAPTTVGYTLITTERGTKKMKSMKGRPDSQPCGILGIKDVYKSTFGMDPPVKCSHSEKYIMGHLGTPATSSYTSFVPEDAIGSKGEVGVWLENGSVVDYLANRLWSEFGDVIVASSCNMAGEGNPKSDRYDLKFVNSKLRSMVDLVIDIPHWEVPRLDDDGRWLSACIWEIGTKNFVRKGRDYDIVSKLVLQNESLQRELGVEFEGGSTDLKLPISSNSTLVH